MGRLVRIAFFYSAISIALLLRTNIFYHASLWSLFLYGVRLFALELATRKGTPGTGDYLCCNLGTMNSSYNIVHSVSVLIHHIDISMLLHEKIPHA